LVYISQDMLRILEAKVDEGEFTVKDAERILGKERLAQTLFDMYVQGLVDAVGPERFITTDQARRILETWISLGKPAADPWLDTRIYTMLHASIEAGGYIPEKWRPILEERGLATGEGPVLEAYEVVEAIARSSRRLHVSKPLARTLIALPEGPAANTYYRGSGLADSLEAMGLLAASIPLGHYMVLTRPGRLLRRALQQLNLDSPSPLVVSSEIREALERAVRGEALSDAEKKVLGELGYISGTGALRPAAHTVLSAWRLLSEPYETPPFSLSQKELLLMESVKEQWEKVSNNPEEAPTPKLLKEKLAPSWSGEYYSVTLTLYHLEAMGLVERDIFEKREVIRLTGHGEKILEASGGRPSTALAARALVEGDAGRGPSEKWIELARGEALLGVGGPTRYGRALVKAAREAVKSLFLTGLEALILKRLPQGRSVRREMIVESFKRYGEDISTALDKLETRGLVKTTPVGYIAITDLGAKLKNAVLGVERGIATPVNPVLIKVLRAVAEMGTEDPARLINTLRLDVDTVKTAIVLARSAKYIGRGSGLTESGKALLEIVEELGAEAALESSG